MSTNTAPLVAKAVGFVAGAAAASGLAALAYAAGYDSIGKGMIQGASATLGIIVILWAVGPRLGLAGRVAAGQGDERDDRILTSAFADSAFGMLFGALGSMVGSFYGLPGWGAAGIVIWAGLMTFLISTVVRSRRN